MDIRGYNRDAWDRQVEEGNPWTIPVTPEAIAEARQGHWQITVTPSKLVPREWFPPNMAGLDVLCLASGGGQQGPILAATGANVTVFDNSPKQLEQDRMVAEREGLTMTTVEGDMTDLSTFPDQRFDLVVNPISNLFIADVRPLWAEAFRVLRRGGTLISGFNNPAYYLFDRELARLTGILQVKYKLPFSEVHSLSEPEKQRLLAEGSPLEFSHTLNDQIGGQLAVGFIITGFYENAYSEDIPDLVNKYMPTFIATRATKP